MSDTERLDHNNPAGPTSPRTGDAAEAGGHGGVDEPGGGEPARPGAGEKGPAAARAVDKLADLGSALWRPLVLLGLLFAGWWFVTARGMVAPYLVPPPVDVATTFVDQWGTLARHTAATVSATVWGFVGATLIGVLTAILIVYSTTLEKALYPVILFAQVIPKIAIAPILVVWFGFGAAPKIILAVLIAFFPVVISGVAGLRAVDPEHLDLAATMGATRLRTFVKIRFPGALPHLFSGLKVAVTLAVVGAVVGEFVGASEGLGYILLVASGNLNSSLLFADLLLMSAIGVALFVVIEVAERLLLPWHPSRRTDLVTA